MCNEISMGHHLSTSLRQLGTSQIPYSDQTDLAIKFSAEVTRPWREVLARYSMWRASCSQIDHPFFPKILIASKYVNIKKGLRWTEKIRTICPIFPDVSSSHFVQHVGFHRRNDDWDASRGAKPDPIPRSSTVRPEMSQDMCKMPNKKPWFLGGSINRGWDNISVFFCFMFMLDEQQNWWGYSDHGTGRLRVVAFCWLVFSSKTSRFWWVSNFWDMNGYDHDPCNSQVLLYRSNGWPSSDAVAITMDDLSPHWRI